MILLCIFPVDVQTGAIPCSGFFDQCQVIDTDISLDGIIGLTLPFPWGFLQIEAVPDRKLPQSIAERMCVVDDNLCPHILPVLHPLREDGADVLLLDIFGVDHPCLMGQDDRLALVACKAFGCKYLLREAQLPTDGSIWILIFKNTHPSQDGIIH